MCLRLWDKCTEGLSHSGKLASMLTPGPHRLPKSEPSSVRRRGDREENKVPCFLCGCLNHYIVLYPPVMSHEAVAAETIRKHPACSTLPDSCVNTWRQESPRVLPSRSVGKINTWHTDDRELVLFVICVKEIMQASLKWHKQPRFVDNAKSYLTQTWIRQNILVHEQRACVNYGVKTYRLERNKERQRWPIGTWDEADMS